MVSPTNGTVTVTRTQLWLALAVSALSLLGTVFLAMATYSLNPGVLFVPFAPALLILGIVALLVRERQTDVDAPLGVDAADDLPATADPGNNGSTSERPITVDEDREAYGIYATLQTLSSSLNLDDTLTLVADQVVRLVADITVEIYLAESDQGSLRLSSSYGRRAESLHDGAGETAMLLATSALHRTTTVVDAVEFHTESGQTEKLPVMGARLVHEDEPFGVLLLIRDVDRTFDEVEINELETVALFAAPGIHRARTQLRSQESALLDPFMQLPNHRAACGILDQRIAESLRFRNGEPVAVISLNLGDDEDRSGLDSELKTLCPIVAAQLRQMDILARGDRNELLIVLPRATRAEANLVAERIQRALESHSLPTKPNAHFGMGIGAFPRDGETASEILLRARNDVRPDDPDIHDSSANVVPLDRWR